MNQRFEDRVDQPGGEGRLGSAGRVQDQNRGGHDNQSASHAEIRVPKMNVAI